MNRLTLARPFKLHVPSIPPKELLQGREFI